MIQLDEGALLIDLHAAQNDGVNMAAADQAEVGGGIGEAAAEGDGKRRAVRRRRPRISGVIVGVARASELAPCADDAQLSVDWRITCTPSGR